VEGELVRTSLEKLLLRKGISAETVLSIEYIPAVGPPSDEATGKHEDWVSAAGAYTRSR
jgi:ribosome biogenesis protein YTM1